MSNRFDPNFYAHLADDSAMIQAAVDAAVQTGESVTIPRHNARTGAPVWIITRAILLPENSVIYLNNCHLRQGDGVFDNIFRNSLHSTPQGFTRAGRQSNISIIGMGNCILDGGEYNGMNEANYKEKFPGHHIYENCMFNFLNVEKVNIRNIRIIHQRYWAFVFHYASHVQISGIDFYAPWDWRNQDGVDIRSGCSHFLIENLTGVTGDDVVAMTNLKNIFEDPMKPCRYDDSIHNIVVRNLRCSTKHSLVRILNHGGRKIYNVLIEDLMYDCESDPTDDRPGKYVGAGQYEPIHPEIYRFAQDYGVRIGTNAYNGTDPFATFGDTYNITIRNLSCRGLAGVCLSCTAKDVLIENVRMYGKGGTGVFIAQGDIRNIRIRDVLCCGTPDADFDDREYECELHGNNDLDYATLPERQCAAIYFKESSAKSIDIRDLHVGAAYTAAIGGYGHAEVTLSGLTMDDPATPVNTGVGIEVTEK